MLDTWYFSTHEVVVLMRSWFAGTVPSAPRDVAFECSAQVAATLKFSRPPSAADWVPGARIGSLAELTGLTVITRPDLDDGEWQLTAPIGDLTPVTVVVREGNTRDGKPTALERAYWLVEFHLVTCVDPAFAGAPSVNDVVRRRVVSYALAHGHEADPRDVKITRKPPADDSPWLTWTYQADLFVPREPVRYPECGDWLCHDPDHYVQADPVNDAAVFAGVMAEKRYIGPQLENGVGYWMPDGYGCMVHYTMADLIRDAITRRRSKTDGKPLWTIDTRPKAS